MSTDHPSSVSDALRGLRYPFWGFVPTPAVMEAPSGMMRKRKGLSSCRAVRLFHGFSAWTKLLEKRERERRTEMQRRRLALSDRAILRVENEESPGIGYEVEGYCIPASSELHKETQL
jgi:hypothetical protein